MTIENFSIEPFNKHIFYCDKNLSCPGQIDDKRKREVKSNKTRAGLLINLHPLSDILLLILCLSISPLNLPFI